MEQRSYHKSLIPELAAFGGSRVQFMFNGINSGIHCLQTRAHNQSTNDVTSSDNKKFYEHACYVKDVGRDAAARDKNDNTLQASYRSGL
jgi:hypothetical protein